MGAHHVIDHREPLATQLRALDIEQVDAAINLADTDRYWEALGELVAPQGHVGLIVEPSGALRIGDPYKAKCIGIHWEMMFARSRFETPDIAEQGALLAEVAALVDAGRIRTTANASFGTINAANLRKAHALIESGKAQGKSFLAVDRVSQAGQGDTVLVLTEGTGVRQIFGLPKEAKLPIRSCVVGVVDAVDAGRA